MAQVIDLKNGPTLPIAVFELALALETRGFTFQAVGDQLRVIPPRDTNGTERDTLSEIDREAIKKWKLHLLAVVDYDAPPIC